MDGKRWEVVLTVVVNSGEVRRLWTRRCRRCRGPQWIWSARRDPEECGDLAGVVGVAVCVQWRGGGAAGGSVGGRSFGCGSPSVSGCTIKQEVSSRRCARVGRREGGRRGGSARPWLDEFDDERRRRLQIPAVKYAAWRRRVRGGKERAERGAWGDL
jgi:hypothetical protein